ncbi:MAG: hypothetical protein P9M14_14950 [Candidatus Alcyoniella australis]|nr:hypothetical protein [Candidatus Alcyoniella australis]
MRARLIDLPFVLLALVLGLIAYWPALHGELVYDDILVYGENSMIADGDNLSQLFSPQYFSAAGESTYRPLLTLSYFCDYAIWGNAAFGPRLTNLLLHLLAATLVVATLRRVGYLGRAAAWCGGLLFLLHPLAVESVASVGNRDEALICCIYLLAVLLFQSQAHSPAARAAKYFGVVALFLAGLFVMEIIVTLPAALVLISLLDRRQERRAADAWQRALIDSMALWIVALIYLLGIRSMLTQDIGGDPLLDRGGSLGLLATMPGVFLSYVRMVFWPTGLAADYFRPILSLGDVRAWGPLLCWLALAAWTVRAVLRRDRRALVPALFAVTIAPVSQIVPFWVLMADRYLYLPMIPLIGLAVWLAQQLTALVSLPRARFRLRLALVVVALIALGSLTFVRAGLWGDNQKLWADTVSKQPQSAKARFNYAYGLRVQGKLDRASEQYLVALGLGGPDSNELAHLADTLSQLGEQQRAAQLIRDGLALWPANEKLRVMLALNLLNSGQIQQARLLLNPEARRPTRSVKLLEVLLLWAMLEREPEYLADYSRRLLELDPGNSMYHQVFGHLHQRAGQNAQAALDYFLAYRNAETDTVRQQACNRLMNLRSDRGTIHGCDP